MCLVCSKKLPPSVRTKPEERADNRTSWTILHHWRRVLPSNFVPEKTARLYSVDRFFTSLTQGHLYLTILYTIYKLLLAYMKLLLVRRLVAGDSSLTFPSFLFFRYYGAKICFLEAYFWEVCLARLADDLLRNLICFILRWILNSEKHVYKWFIMLFYAWRKIFEVLLMWNV